MQLSQRLAEALRELLAVSSLEAEYGPDFSSRRIAAKRAAREVLSEFDKTVLSESHKDTGDAGNMGAL